MFQSGQKPSGEREVFEAILSAELGVLRLGFSPVRCTVAVRRPRGLPAPGERGALRAAAAESRERVHGGRASQMLLRRRLLSRAAEPLTEGFGAPLAMRVSVLYPEGASPSWGEGGGV